VAKVDMVVKLLSVVGASPVTLSKVAMTWLYLNGRVLKSFLSRLPRRLSARRRRLPASRLPTRRRRVRLLANASSSPFLSHRE
jgi:hypothetical protein